MYCIGNDELWQVVELPLLYRENKDGIINDVIYPTMVYDGDFYLENPGSAKKHMYDHGA